MLFHHLTITCDSWNATATHLADKDFERCYEADFASEFVDYAFSLDRAKGALKCAVTKVQEDSSWNND